MATPNLSSFEGLEEEMREAFFLDPPISTPDYPEMETRFDDPAISTPDPEMIFESKIKKIQSPLLRKLSARYPSLFPASSLHELKNDPLESIWRNPEKTEFLPESRQCECSLKVTDASQYQYSSDLLRKIPSNRSSTAIKRIPRPYREYQAFSEQR